MTHPNAPVTLMTRSGGVNLSLTMGQLYVVSRRWPSIWAEFNRIMGLDKRTIGDMARVCYAASCCSAIADGCEPAYEDIESFEKDMLPGLDVIDAVYDGYMQLMPASESGAFREAFERRARGSSSSIRLPRLKLESPDDYYVYMVVICGISENLFWNADFSLLWDVARSKGAFDSWLAGEHERRR